TQTWMPGSSPSRTQKFAASRGGGVQHEHVAEVAALRIKVCIGIYCNILMILNLRHIRAALRALLLVPRITSLQNKQKRYFLKPQNSHKTIPFSKLKIP